MTLRMAAIKDTSHLGEVFRLYRPAKGTLGHMPRGGFEEAVAKGTLIGAWDGGSRLAGYVLYRIANRNACIAHVCVDKSMRRMRVAEQMLNHLKQTTAHLDGIKLKCRDDYETSPLWRKCGFIARKGAVGRGADAAALTVWHFGHNQTDLFSEAAPGKPKVVIDANVFFDLTNSDRPRRRSSLALANPWVEDAVELALSPEVFNDINRNPDPATRETSRSKARGFQEIRASGMEVDRIAGDLRKLYPPGTAFTERDLSDVRHLAFTVAAGEHYFVTHDQRLLGLAPEILQNHGLQVLSPAELVSHLDMIQREREYQPRRLGGTSVRTKKLDALDVPTAIEVFRHPQEGTRDLRALLESALVNPQNGFCGLTHENPDRPAVLLCASPSSDSLIDLNLVRSAGSALAPTILRNRLMELVQEAAKGGHSAIRVTDPWVSPVVRAALEELGFRHANGSWRKPLMEGFHELPAITAGLSAHALPLPPHELPAELDSLGTLIWPGKIASDRLNCYLVPIEARWAEHFFDSDLARTRFPALSGIREDLHLGVEGVYYSATSMTLGAPGYILWYVSKGKERTGTQDIKAISRLREMATGTPKALFRRFSRLGVYRWKDVMGKAKGDPTATLTALRFSHTELLPHPIPGKRLPDYGIAHPYGPRIVTHATFRQILNHASSTSNP